MQYSLTFTGNTGVPAGEYVLPGYIGHRVYTQVVSNRNYLRYNSSSAKGSGAMRASGAVSPKKSLDIIPAKGYGA